MGLHRLICCYLYSQALLFLRALAQPRTPDALSHRYFRNGPHGHISVHIIDIPVLSESRLFILIIIFWLQRILSGSLLLIEVTLTSLPTFLILLIPLGLLGDIILDMDLTLILLPFLTSFLNSLLPALASITMLGRYLYSFLHLFLNVIGFLQYLFHGYSFPLAVDHKRHKILAIQIHE